MLADSHIHLFKNGFEDSRGGELSQYKVLMKKYSINCALVIGYEGSPWASGNNEYIALLLPFNPWMHALGFVRPSDLNVNRLREFDVMGFEGVSLYLSTEFDLDQLFSVDNSTWE